MSDLEKKLTAYIGRRLKSLQLKHNFNPDAPSSQVEGYPDLYKDYSEFKTLLTLADKFGLNVKVPYDAAGLAPLDHLKKRQQAPRYIYITQVLGRDVYKLGCSKTPYKRTKNLQVGHDGHLSLRYQYEGTFALEKNLKRKYRKHKTRDRNKSEGEWFNFTLEQIQEVREYLQGHNAKELTENKESHGGK